MIGAGTLGRRIALMMADRGGTVQVHEPDASVRESARRYLDATLPEVAAGIEGGAVGTVHLLDDLAGALRSAWLVVEAVPERLELKREVFAQLDAAAEPDAILASNSSSYATADFADAVSCPERLLNTHFYQPPELNAVELMSSGSTDPAIIDLLVERLPRHGLPTFVAHARSTGFIFNRIWAAIKRESLRVVADGVSTPGDIDAIWQLTFGTGFGPFGLMDRVGLDVVRDIERHYLAEDPTLDDRQLRVLEEYIARGDLGVKTGRGFFDYPPEA
ncbi:3-hydroxyacyl-CoA dehydrogenase family protein [Ornithinimicrobium flavum]|uniref:3-hydroxyacyl-CoA dehydrogenase family protein n=1 Tax=Ornithinimicrobium flavum TaxID=1288636 RepID=UPI001EE9690E|nr:3-hydroxyacyl-CoA dehydrogenase family protein [Ornithinimicrobium flavum]